MSEQRMDSETLTSMYAEVGNGIAKEDSRFTAEPGFSEAWDRAVAEIAQIRAEYPGVAIDLPL